MLQRIQDVRCEGPSSCDDLPFEKQQDQLIALICADRFAQQMMPPFMQDDQPFVGMGDLFIGVDAALQRYDLIRISMQEQDRTVHAGDAVTAVADDLHERRIKALWYACLLYTSMRPYRIRPVAALPLRFR